MALVLFCLFVAGVLAWQIWYRMFRSPLAQIPGPWLGKVTGLYEKYYLVQAKLHTKLSDLHEEYGPIVHFGPNQVSMNSKKSVDIIYKSNLFLKSQLYQAFSFGGANMATVSNQQSYNSWKRVVKKIFGSPNLKKIEPTIKEHVLTSFVEKLERLGTCDIYEAFHFITFDVVVDFLFSCKLNLVSNGDHPIVNWLRDAQFYGILQFLVPQVKHSKGHFGQEGFEAMIRFCQEIIDKRREEGPKEDTLQDLMDMIDDATGKPFSIEDVRAELIILMIGAIDTTANTLFWTLKLLLENPTEMEKLIAEIDAAFPSPDSITLDTIKEKCPYLAAVFNESMRMYPVGGGRAPRIVPKGGAEFEGYYLPAGTECGVTIYAYHRSSHIWKDPDTFRPTRFLGPGSAEAKENMIPFLTGPRACVGREMAKMIMNLTLVTLLRRFHIRWNSSNPNPATTPICHIVLKPQELNFLIDAIPRCK
ncbi:hypothetical protein DSO57_1035993 [Entomophthora muscae]|uniref:Uncharacterized protein n=1 Tax=Entomophthora muscae TaxID=34485 RepID=A0ACC2SNS5_9FUNG|nr:hypothetical protein DSO57_1035993 [Entomophthora muscae]